ncbi:MAG: hypothetical protein WA160_05080, partial [Pseudobdellovibrio sp.]
LEQSVTLVATAGLRNIEADITKFVRMKVLMRRGLTFTKEEVELSQSKATKAACNHGVPGCK